MSGIIDSMSPSSIHPFLDCLKSWIRSILYSIILPNVADSSLNSLRLTLHKFLPRPLEIVLTSLLGGDSPLRISLTSPPSSFREILLGGWMCPCSISTSSLLIESRSQLSLPSLTILSQLQKEFPDAMIQISRGGIQLSANSLFNSQLPPESKRIVLLHSHCTTSLMYHPKFATSTSPSSFSSSALHLRTTANPAVALAYKCITISCPPSPDLIRSACKLNLTLRKSSSLQERVDPLSGDSPPRDDSTPPSQPSPRLLPSPLPAVCLHSFSRRAPPPVLATPLSVSQKVHSDILNVRGDSKVSFGAGSHSVKSATHASFHSGQSINPLPSSASESDLFQALDASPPANHLHINSPARRDLPSTNHHAVMQPCPLSTSLWSCALTDASRICISLIFPVSSAIPETPATAKSRSTPSSVSIPQPFAKRPPPLYLSTTPTGSSMTHHGADRNRFLDEMNGEEEETMYDRVRTALSEMNVKKRMQELACVSVGEALQSNMNFSLISRSNSLADLETIDQIRLDLPNNVKMAVRDVASEELVFYFKPEEQGNFYSNNTPTLMDDLLRLGYFTLFSNATSRNNHVHPGSNGEIGQISFKSNTGQLLSLKWKRIRKEFNGGSNLTANKSKTASINPFITNTTLKQKESSVPCLVLDVFNFI